MLELEPEPEPVMDPNEACWAQRIAVCPSFFMFGQKRKKKKGEEKKKKTVFHRRAAEPRTTPGTD